MSRIVVLALAAAAGSVSLSAQSYIPQRVYNAANGMFSDFEIMTANLAAADVVFVDELHDDPNAAWPRCWATTRAGSSS